MAWLSVLGLYHYDNDIFNELALPEEIDRTDFITNLLAECAELEVIYPDGEIMRQMIGAWSRSRLNTWERIAAVLYEDYDPFVNIKRDEVRTIESTGSSEVNSGGTNTDKVSAWDSTAFANRGQTDTSNNSTGETTNSVRETLHVEGDSAITDAQDVARKEVDLRLKYDLYRIIIEDFRNRFCLLVY